MTACPALSFRPVNGTTGSAALEGCSAQCGTEPLTWGFGLERAKGIEPS